MAYEISSAIDPSSYPNTFDIFLLVLVQLQPHIDRDQYSSHCVVCVQGQTFIKIIMHKEMDVWPNLRRVGRLFGKDFDTPYSIMVMDRGLAGQ